MVLPVGGTMCSVVILTYICVTAIADDVIISVITINAMFCDYVKEVSFVSVV